MDRLRKIIQWTWQAKERMVLLVMLGVLSWRVYEVLNPGDTEERITFRSPVSPAEGAAPPPPPPPPPLPSPDIGPLVRRNPFWVNPNQSGGGPDDLEGVSLTILSIQQLPNGDYTAKIRTSTATKWIKKGGSFESYELREIDPDSKCCEIWSEDHNKTLKRCIQ